jgi:hypothetical protein
MAATSARLAAAIAVLPLAALAALAPAGCAQERIAETDEVYFDWDQRRVLCGAGIDERNANDLDNLDEGMARARDRGEVLVLFAHEPGDGGGADLSLDKLDGVLDLAVANELDFFTFADLADPDPDLIGRGGIALTFDDASVQAWYDVRDRFAARAARATFFVTRLDQQSDTKLAMLHELADAGHGIESHGLRHLNAPDYVEEFGLQAYLDDEVLPSLAAMRERGFEPTSFAYPYGHRTDAIDRALLEHVQLLRSISWTFSYPLVMDPCPE